MAGARATATAAVGEKFNDEHKITSKVYGRRRRRQGERGNAKYDITGKLTAGARRRTRRAPSSRRERRLQARGGAISSGLTAFTAGGVHRGLAKDPAQRAQVTNHETRGRDELL